MTRRRRASAAFAVRHRWRHGRGTCCRRVASPRRSSPTVTTVATIHYVGATRGVETPAAARDAVPAHVVRRRRAQRRLRLDATPAFLPKLCRRRGRRSARSASCGRRSSSPSAATPACRAARRRRSTDPVVVVSYDRAPGRRQAARRAGAGGLSPWRSPARRLPRAGSPARRCGRRSSTSTAAATGRRPARRSACRRPVRRRRRRRVAGLGGAQRGGRRLRRPSRRSTTDLAVHQSSATASSPTPRPRDGATACCTSVVGYEDRMALVYAAADLLVGRGGASTVPRWPSTGHARDPRAVAGRRRGPPDDNVRWLADQGAAMLLDGAS